MNRQSKPLQTLLAARHRRSLLNVSAAATRHPESTPENRTAEAAARRPVLIAVSGAAGGVGRSCVSLHLARCLAAGGRTCLLDANEGLSHTAVLGGLTSWPSVADGFLGAGGPARSLYELPGGVCGMAGLAPYLAGTAGEAELARVETSLADFECCVADVGLRTSPAARRALVEADVAVLVTTPTPLALAETYAAMKALRSRPSGHLAVVLNRVRDAAVGRLAVERLTRTSQTFLGRRPSAVAMVADDPSVERAAEARDCTQVNCEGPFHAAIAGFAARLSRRAGHERVAA